MTEATKSYVQNCTQSQIWLLPDMQWEAPLSCVHPCPVWPASQRLSSSVHGPSHRSRWNALPSRAQSRFLSASHHVEVLWVGKSPVVKHYPCLAPFLFFFLLHLTLWFCFSCITIILLLLNDSLILTEPSDSWRATHSWLTWWSLRRECWLHNQPRVVREFLWTWIVFTTLNPFDGIL